MQRIGFKCMQEIDKDMPIKPIKGKQFMELSHVLRQFEFQYNQAKFLFFIIPYTIGIYNKTMSIQINQVQTDG